MNKPKLQRKLFVQVAHGLVNMKALEDADMVVIEAMLHGYLDQHDCTAYVADVKQIPDVLNAFCDEISVVASHSLSFVDTQFVETFESMDADDYEWNERD